MTDEELEDKATAWIRSQGWSEENLPSDEYLQMRTAYVAGAKENGVVWHDLWKDPNDLPNGDRDVLNQVGMATRYDSNRGFLGFDGIGVIAWCEIPKFEEGV